MRFTPLYSYCLNKMYVVLALMIFKCNFSIVQIKSEPMDNVVLMMYCDNIVYKQLINNAACCFIIFAINF